jgi:hypothetical protein
MPKDEAEDEPFKGAEEMEPTRVQLKGPNTISTFDTPLHPHALKAHDAAIRKHLHELKPRQDPSQD